MISNSESLGRRRGAAWAAVWVIAATGLMAAGCGGGGGPEPSAGVFATKLVSTDVPVLNPGEISDPSSLEDIGSAIGLAQWGLVFFVEEDTPDELAYVASCGYTDWGIPDPDLVSGDPEGLDNLAGVSVPVEDGEFTVDNGDLRLSGELTDSVTMEGTIEAKSRTATRCGLPERAEWKARCGADNSFGDTEIDGEEVIFVVPGCREAD